MFVWNEKLQVSVYLLSWSWYETISAAYLTERHLDSTREEEILQTQEINMKALQITLQIVGSSPKTNNQNPLRYNVSSNTLHTM